MEALNDYGIVLALLGAALAALVPGMASAKAVSMGASIHLSGYPSTGQIH